jgi:8-oxo-dGTP diphosphatase
MTNRTRYVVGFAFDPPGEHVMLVQKSRPSWQAGLLNGVGGHVEPGENPHEAMAREFQEETGVETLEKDWRHFCTVVTDKSVVHMFAARFSRERIATARTATDESIVVVRAGELHDYETLPNLRWLVPMARRADDILEAFEVRERARYET